MKNKKVGILPKGKNNRITDVPGVKVGHVTLIGENVNTGVTVVIPGENIFREKMIAGAHVINGFGKSAGLLQVDELGSLETPIALTNTLCVGRASMGLIQYTLKENPELYDSTDTINPVVFECNDGGLSDLYHLLIEEGDVLEAIENASEDFEQGAVGAGRGMICYGFKGGIGTSSRVISFEETSYTLGALVLTNFGVQGDLSLLEEKAKQEEEEKGSVIVILATDAPLRPLEAKRLCKRAQSGLAKTGSFCANGSGEIAFCFSTAARVPHTPQGVMTFQTINNTQIDKFFRGVSECVEEAVYNSLYAGEKVSGKGKTVLPFRGRNE